MNMNEHLPPAPEDDGLLIPDVKPWSFDKHHFLMRYIDAFTNAMKKKGWTGLHYIDLFAGAGIENVEGRGLEWGSPLIAAHTRYPFTQLHLVEKRRQKFDALATRIEKIDLPDTPQMICGDANQIVNEVSQSIPRGSLSLAFLDPYGLHLDFQTVRVLAGDNRRRIDLIIFFPDRLDALRNWNAYYKGKPDSNLTRVLGTDSWELELNNSAPDRWADVLTKIYERQIRTLGFEHFDYERINDTEGRPLYRLIFCCKHRAGGDIWRKISLRKPDRQDSFQWD